MRMFEAKARTEQVFREMDRARGVVFKPWPFWYVLLPFIAILAALAIACGSTPPPKQPTQPRPPVVRPIAFHTCEPTAQVWLDGAGVPATLATPVKANASGFVGFPVFPGDVTAFNVHASAANHDPYGVVVSGIRPGGSGIDFFLGACEQAARASYSLFYPLAAWPSLHVDPSTIPLQQLAAIRGAMWPNASRCPGGLTLPYGPRPGQPDNIIATDFFANYTRDQQLASMACLRALGYTHVVVGPIVDSDGYHGQYAPHDWHWEDASHLTGDNWEKFLDIIQDFADHGLTAVVFGHPDGWTFEQTRDVLTPLLQLPRAQKLIRIFVPTGWEPTKYGWSSQTWAAFVGWAHQTLPNALILIHTVSDVDAPVGTDERGDDNGHPNGEGWTRVVNAGLDGWLIQNGAYKVSPPQDPELARNFGSQFQPDGDGAALHGARWHFVHQILGWPSTTLRGWPLLLYNAEVTAFEGYWNNLPEAVRVQWGDLSVASLSDGYLDGGSVAVPVRR